MLPHRYVYSNDLDDSVIDCIALLPFENGGWNEAAKRVVSELLQGNNPRLKREEAVKSALATSKKKDGVGAGK